MTFPSLTFLYNNFLVVTFPRRYLVLINISIKLQIYLILTLISTLFLNTRNLSSLSVSYSNPLRR